jgi:hypothetical protein
LPFYCCDAVLEPIRALGVGFEFYGLNDSLEPVRMPSLKEGDLLLYINYFGLKGAAAEAIAAEHGEKVVIDSTHAFYDRGYAGAWSFNSARKFFGVPDGGYLYAPRPLKRTFPPNPNVRVQHLVARLTGRDDAAFSLYQENEAGQVSSPCRMSNLTQRLLANVDHDWVKSKRIENFAAYDRALSSLNGLCLSDRPLSARVPFCYPLLLQHGLPHRLLHERKLYVPRLWEDILRRMGPGYAWERRLAGVLLPLPVDHRLTVADTIRVTNDVVSLMPHEPGLAASATAGRPRPHGA